MIQETQILRDNDPRCAELEALGYTVVAESWGARLTLDEDIGSYLATIHKLIGTGIDVREIGIEFAEEVLQLEITNNPDYPKTPANLRLLPTIEVIRDLWRPKYRVFGALSDGVLVGVLATRAHGEIVELDFGSLLREYRGKGIGKALCSRAIIAWFRLGNRTFGTGGAMANDASLGTVKSLGFSVVERWRSYQC